jgi:hypothetical protein
VRDYCGAHGYRHADGTIKPVGLQITYAIRYPGQFFKRRLDGVSIGGLAGLVGLGGGEFRFDILMYVVGYLAGKA